MLILNMILRITRFTQEELANYLDLSRASINSWLSDDTGMSNQSKRRIADRFGFPVMYFDYDLEQNIELYKLIYSTINNYWKRNRPTTVKVDKINEILNIVESSVVEKENFTDIEIINGLIDGYNPFTGEVFEESHILNDLRIKAALSRLKNRDNNKFGVANVTKNDLNSDERKLFEELRKWRLSKRDEEGYYSAYMVFNDKELINIIKANVRNETDLANIKGIGYVKYNKYSDELFKIISNHNKNLQTEAILN